MSESLRQRIRSILTEVRGWWEEESDSPELKEGDRILVIGDYSGEKTWLDLTVKKIRSGSGDTFWIVGDHMDDNEEWNLFYVQTPKIMSGRLIMGPYALFPRGSQGDRITMHDCTVEVINK